MAERLLPRRLVAAGALWAAGLPLHALAANDAGRAAFERCSACHTLAASGQGGEGVGPSLHALLGRRAGSVDGFRYSGPLKRSGIVWSADTLAAFLRDPQAVVPGNRMAFSGIADEAELRALIGYLASDTSTPKTR